MNGRLCRQSMPGKAVMQEVKEAVNKKKKEKVPVQPVPEEAPVTKETPVPEEAPAKVAEEVKAPVEEAPAEEAPAAEEAAPAEDAE